MEHFGRLDKGDDSGPKENDKLKDCCAEVYEGFKRFGKKWYKFTLFRKMNGGDENGDSTLDSTKENDTTADDDEDLDEEEEDLDGEGLDEEGDLDEEDELDEDDEEGEDEDGKEDEGDD